MAQSLEETNKALVLAAFDAAFNQRAPDAYERYWSPTYIQHSAHIPPGREGLRDLVAAAPPICGTRPAWWWPTAITC